MSNENVERICCYSLLKLKQAAAQVGNATFSSASGIMKMFASECLQVASGAVSYA